MSGLYENMPFKRGATYGTTDTSVGKQYEGKIYVHEDQAYGTGLFVTVRVCRNNSGAALQPRRAVKFNLTAGVGFSDVAGYSSVTAEKSGVVDDLILGTAGVPAGDLFYVVVGGPCLAKTSSQAGAENSIAVGDGLHATTGATTGATTAGRVGEALFTGATAVLAGQICNVVGRAMSAMTTSQTNTDILLNAGSF